MLLNLSLCLKQHSKDLGLESPADRCNGKYYDGKEENHPAYLGGRYPECESLGAVVLCSLTQDCLVCKLGVWVCSKAGKRLVVAQELV